MNIYTILPSYELQLLFIYLFQMVGLQIHKFYNDHERTNKEFFPLKCTQQISHQLFQQNQQYAYCFLLLFITTSISFYHHRFTIYPYNEVLYNYAQPIKFSQCSLFYKNFMTISSTILNHISFHNLSIHQQHKNRRVLFYPLRNRETFSCYQYFLILLVYLFLYLLLFYLVILSFRQGKVKYADFY